MAFHQWRRGFEPCARRSIRTRITEFKVTTSEPSDYEGRKTAERAFKPPDVAVGTGKRFCFLAGKRIRKYYDDDVYICRYCRGAIRILLSESAWTIQVVKNKKKIRQTPPTVRGKHDKRKTL